MNVTFSCPKCHQDTRSEIEPAAATLTCAACGQVISAPEGAFRNRALARCLVCPSTDLFIRKDFPQRLGVGIVVFGIVASSIAWGYSLPIATFAILFATALVDVVLYAIVPDALMCYRCGAQYRMAGDMDGHTGFNLEIHERYRQQAARMASGAQR